MLNCNQTSVSFMAYFSQCQDQPKMTLSSETKHDYDNVLANNILGAYVTPSTHLIKVVFKRKIRALVMAQES